jgi:GMP synthase-like glutamine amidotransferase
MERSVAIFQHVPREPAGIFETVFAETGIPFEYIRLCDTNEVPRAVDASHLLFMGGPMSVNDEKELPWLAQEKALIRRSAKDGQKVLGICLGAQLIASAHGARVYPFVAENGWHPLFRAVDATGAFAEFPDRFMVFQLHGETFEIPYGGRLQACGDRVRNQAFRCKNALGLQFHLELTGEIIRDWSRDLNAFQREKIERETPRYLAESNRLCRRVAGEFLGE